MHSGCYSGACIFQGNQFVGGDIVGGAASGDTYGIFFNTIAFPAWDSNNVRGPVGANSGLAGTHLSSEGWKWGRSAWLCPTYIQHACVLPTRSLTS